MMEKRRARICHMTSAHKRYDVRVFCKECVSLAAAGYEVSLVVCDDKEDEVKDGVQIHSTGSSYKHRLDRMTHGVHDVYKIAIDINADLYHIHDPELLTIALKLKRNGKYVVFDSHERYARQIMIKEYIPALMRRLLSKTYHSFETYVCRKIDAVVIPGERDDYTSFDTRCKRCTVIRNTPILKNNTVINLKENITKRVLIQHGSLTKERGITEMVIAGYRTHSKVILVGIMDEGYRKELFDMKESGCIEILGGVQHDRIADLLRQASIGIAVMHNVGQYGDMSIPPTKVLEFAYFGLPVIGSRTTAILKKFIEENHCGISVDPNNMDEFVDAINYLYNHPDEASEMGKRGRKAVEKCWNWKDDAERLVNLYMDVLG